MLARAAQNDLVGRLLHITGINVTHGVRTGLIVSSLLLLPFTVFVMLLAFIILYVSVVLMVLPL